MHQEGRLARRLAGPTLGLCLLLAVTLPDAPLVHAPVAQDPARDVCFHLKGRRLVDCAGLHTAAARAAILTDNDKACPILNSPFTVHPCPTLR